MWTTLALQLITLVVAAAAAAGHCDPLSPSSENVLLTCVNGNGNGTRCVAASDRSVTVTPSITVRYSCREHYAPLRGLDGGGTAEEQREVVCGADGQWTKGLSRFKSFFCVEDCGRRKANPKPLIINGVRTERISWPWHATIFRRRTLRHRNGTTTTRWIYICGGSIVRNSIILTAAHCLSTEGRSAELLPAHHFKVVVGAQTSVLDLNQAGSSAQVFEVKALYHIIESYDPTKDYQADIAILHLEPGMRFTDYVAPVCLPTDNGLEVDALRSGRVGQVAGFGIDETGNVSTHLKYGNLLIKDRAECFSSLRTKLSETQFCAGTLRDGKWTSVCRGDSGGGLTVPAPVLEKYYVFGVVSFTNPPQSEDEVECHNNAVFTRVLPFMEWVRAVLETIQGVILKDLIQNSEVPFIQNVSAIGQAHKTKMAVWARELDTRVTSIQLSNVQINAEEFLNVLERTKLVHTLNLTDVRVTGSPFGRRVRLPYLRTFILDMAQGSWADNVYFGYSLTVKKKRADPEVRQFLDSVLFFNKEYDQVWKLEQLAGLGVNIQLSFRHVKLIHLDHEEGRLMLNGFPETNDILERWPVGESLKQLHLNYCKLNLSAVESAGSAAGQRHRRHLDLESLVLHDIAEFSGTDVADFLGNCPKLKELVLGVDDKNVSQEAWPTLYLDQLPKTLTHLVLTNIILNANTPSQSRFPSITAFGAAPTSRAQPPKSASAGYEHRIVFDDDGGRRRRVHAEATRKVSAPPPMASAQEFAMVETFVCDNCTVEPGLLENLPKRFPNLRTLILKGRGEYTDLERPLTKYVSNFQHLTKFVLIENQMPNRTGYFGDILEKDGTGESGVKAKVWNECPLCSFSEEGFFDARHLNYFYRAYPDFVNERRHTAPELEAMRTGLFSFKGDVEKDHLPTEKFPTIRPDVQKKLHSIEVHNVEATPTMLQEALGRAAGVRNLVLTGIYLLGTVKEPVHLPALETARVHYVEFEIRELREVLAFEERHLWLMIPFEMPNLSGTAHGRERNATATTRRNTTNSLQRFSLEYDSAIILSWSKPEHHLIISSVEFANEMLMEVQSNRAVTNLIVCYSEIDLRLMPSTLELLHLHDVSLDYGLDNGAALRKLRALKHLRIFEPSTVYSGGRKWLPLQVNLFDLNSETLEDLGVGHVHLYVESRGSSRLPTFSYVGVLSLGMFTMDETVVRHMWNIFPNVTTLTLLLPYEFLPWAPWADAIPAEVRYTYERLLLSALQNPRITWIHASYLHVWNTSIHDGDADDRDKIHRIQVINKLHELLPPSLVRPTFHQWNEMFEFNIAREDDAEGGRWMHFERPGLKKKYHFGLHSLRYWTSREGPDREFVLREGCESSAHKAGCRLHEAFDDPEDDPPCYEIENRPPIV